MSTDPLHSDIEHVEVLIVGAGLSGIGAACHLRRELPAASFLILEAREAMGGTWELFRYPGVRSDSDMYTLGYRFRPWQSDEAIADGPSILTYIHETAAEYRIDERIRYRHEVVAASWSSGDARWTVRARVGGGGETVTLTCGFLFGAAGYYRYDGGHTPEFPGADRFTGQIVHPQHWPEDLEWDGRRVVVIGSGATAVTLVPALAATADHVTMLQRSPTYVVAAPGTDPVAKHLRRVLPNRLAYAVTRWKNILQTLGVYQLSRRRPELIKTLIRKGVVTHLGPDYDVDTHFNPSYNPWDQRMCLVPDGDLFSVIRDGRASVVTDEIEQFTAGGIRLRSGAEIEADVIITATGLRLIPFGGVELDVDGEPVRLSETMAYKAMMLSGVPNFAFAIGYTNSSWTLKVDLVCMYVCRLLAHMRAHGYDTCVAERETGVEERPMIDFQAGYVLRSIASFPKQGARSPWRLAQNYLRDMRELGRGPVDDGVMRFSARQRGQAAGHTQLRPPALAS